MYSYMHLCESAHVHLSECVLISLSLSQPGLTAKQQEWVLSRRKHLHEVNNKRCRRLPMYGCDLIQAVRKICHQEQLATRLGSNNAYIHSLT